MEERYIRPEKDPVEAIGMTPCPCRACGRDDACAGACKAMVEWIGAVWPKVCDKLREGQR